MSLFDGVKLSIGIRLVRVDGDLNSGENAVYLVQHFCPEPSVGYVPISCDFDKERDLPTVGGGAR